ncbi:hypothetical protein D6829_01685 [Candidatus Pacearchaeota archaeon]|nr:MAG: hypothetical protein D6829_01685 [Candidatus Pacearchaeota archaeon]
MVEKDKISLAVVFVVFVFIVWYFFPIDKKTIEAEFILGDIVGIDLNPKKLTFGEAPRGQTLSRGIYIENTLNEQVIVKITASGEIAKGIFASENNFLMGPLEKRRVMFWLKTSKFRKEGKHKGVVKIAFYRKPFWKGL